MPVQSQLVTLLVHERKAGVYEAAMWRAAGLEEPGSCLPSAGEAGPSGLNEEDDTAEVDNVTAGGLFGWLGRDAEGPRPRVIPQAMPPAPSPLGP